MIVPQFTAASECWTQMYPFPSVYLPSVVNYSVTYSPADFKGVLHIDLCNKSHLKGLE